MKQLWVKIRSGIIWRLAWLISTAIACTVRVHAVGEDRLEKLITDGQGGILATWHGTTMLSIYYCRHKGLWAIISRSRDGELQNRLVMSRGFKTIRGSSGGQGLRAFLEAARKIRDGAVVAITPDGPRGPANIVQPGTVLLAVRGGCDIVPVGVACERAWRFNSWDKHMVPKPFSRAVIVFGEPVRVGECRSDEENQAAADEIGRAMHGVVAEAESMLMAGDKCNVGAV